MADTLQNVPLTLNLSNNGLVAGTTNTLTSTSLSACLIQNRFATALAILTNSATAPLVDATTGISFSLTPVASTPLVGQCAALVFGVNAAGQIRASLGPVAPLESLGVTTTPGNFINLPQFPALPDDFCPISYTIVRSTPAVPSFVVGSSSWANNCSTFRSIGNLPMRPQAN